MFEDQQVELLPERTTMLLAWYSFDQNFNDATAVAVNAGNLNFGGSQYNTALAAALAGSNVAVGH